MDNLHQDIVSWSSYLIEIAGVIAVVLGAVWATVGYFIQFRRDSQAYESFRAHLGRGILVGLEFLVAADIIRTVGVEPTWNSVGILVIIVLIRTFLSTTLSMEINAWFPWERRAMIDKKAMDN